MKLQQLRFLAAVAQNELNITAAAARLSATQPAVSKQLKLLENELGFNLFVRKGRALVRITPSGERVIQHALRILRETQNIKRLSEDLRGFDRGIVSIGTTHTQARYVLPRIVQGFREQYPDVQIHLHQGTSEQIADMVDWDRIDFAIATGSPERFARFVLIPSYRWRSRIVVPTGHVLASVHQPTLEQVAAFPIVTYVFSLSGNSSIQDVFSRAGLRPEVALTARDADVIKTYVRLGLGVGIIAEMAFDPAEDEGLVAIDASHLFPVHTTWIGFARDGLLRKYMYDFIQKVAPHVTPQLVERARTCDTQEEVDALFSSAPLTLPEA